MNNSLDRLFDDIIRLLGDDVVPHLDSDVVRSQVYSAIFMLKNMQMRVDWSADLMAAQIRAQDELFATLGASKANGAVPLPAGPRIEATVLSGKALMAIRDEGNDLVARLIKDASPEAEAHLVRYMRAELDMEVKHTAKPMFAEMSGQAGKRPD